MRVKKFEYKVPKELIAGVFNERSVMDSRLMVVTRKKNGEEKDKIEHLRFGDIINYFGEDDIFVFNDSYMLNNIFYFKKVEDKKDVEVVLLKEEDKKELIWEAYFSSIKKMKNNVMFFLPELGVKVEVLESLFLKRKRIKFLGDIDRDELFRRIEKAGRIDIKKYVGRDFCSSDVFSIKEMFAKNFGSLVPIVAGLHFREKMYMKLQLKDVNFAFLTYHVLDDLNQKTLSLTLDENKILPERVFITDENKEKVNRAKSLNKKVCAVGFSVAIALENLFNAPLKKIYKNDILINKIPFFPKDFNLCNSYLTNFHVCGDLAFMVDAGFCSRELLRKIYDEAIKNKYRFSIYGDSLLIL